MQEERALCDVCFSNRPVRVKRFQAIHHCGVDVARGLVLLYGLGARVLPSWDPKTRWNNLLGGLSVKRTAGPSRTCELRNKGEQGERSDAGLTKILSRSRRPPERTRAPELAPRRQTLRAKRFTSHCKKNSDLSRRQTTMKSATDLPNGDLQHRDSVSE